MLLAWDTTDRLNWGARAGHLATRQLLGSGNDVETLSGTYQRRTEPVGFFLPEWVVEPLRRRSEKYQLVQSYLNMEAALGAQPDFIDSRPSVSLRNILNNLENEFIRELHDMVKRHDPIVVDGNGDIIFKAKPRRTLLADLALIELADHFGKEIHFVNSIFSDCPITGRNEVLAERCVRALKKCESVSFRDPMSLELAHQMADDLDADYIPDSLFHWYDAFEGSDDALPANGNFVLPYTQERIEYLDKLDFDGSYICVTGGSRAAFQPETAYEGYCRLVEQLRRLDPPLYLVPTGAGDQFLEEVARDTGTPFVPAEVPIFMGGAILANAQLFVTGRYHPSIMAASGGTPCVFLGADSHKTLSLQHMLDYDDPQVYSAIPTSEEHDKILSHARALLEWDEQDRRQIQQAVRRRASEARKLTDLVIDSD